MAEIIEFTQALAPHIKKLNYEWLEKYFTVEPVDIKTLSDPQTEIIDKGGTILFAKENEEIVGTASLLKVDAHIYELGKMAVTEAFQGKKIGNLLLEKCIEKAKQSGAEKIILYSNTKLVAAINLYKKFGFKEVEQEKDVIYKRSNIKMELVF